MQRKLPVNVPMLKPEVYSEDLFKGLENNMKAVMILNNIGQWSGGFSQYILLVKNTTISGYSEDDPLTQNS
ncbi:glycoside hydrolase family 5 protein [Piromyces sp. E2]|nr:glycoside hydrolase family 5 protein [Piromyces sp. E2]|eukprot:OUM60353.1 glycoside hydrolase family 5 protein [Piromyces sp. E2]